jgi:hypothetical protein
MSTYELAKQELDVMVKTGQFSAAVSKKEVFENLIKSMQN